MKVEKKDLEKSQIELNVELNWKEFEPYIKKGAQKISQEVKIEGFRKGKAPYEILKRKVGEFAILEESARIAINKTIIDVIDKNLGKKQAIGQPKVDITKLATNNPMAYKIILSVLPDIKLGKYKDLKIKPEKVKINDEEIEKIIKYLAESRVKEIIVNREAKQNDKVLVDIEMFLDKVPVEGGQSKDTVSILGKDYLIPGFDKKIIGAKKGDFREFQLPYPKKHYQKNLAGKMVDFKVKIKEVYKRELPKIDDDFAKTLNFKNVKELKENIKKNIQEEKKIEVEQKNEIKILEAIEKNTEITEIPDDLINHELETMFREFEHNITQQGGKVDDYLTSIKKTKKDLLLDMSPNALKRVKMALISREIAIQENIKVSDKEIDKKIEDLLKKYKGYEKVEERIKNKNYRIYLKNTISNQKVVEKLKKWNLVE